MDRKTKSPLKYADDPLFIEVMKEALDIQERFAAEPIYSKTGKGFLKSVGVEDFKRLKTQRQTAGKAMRDEG